MARIKITGTKHLRAALKADISRCPGEIRQIVAKHGARLQDQTQSNMDRAYTAGYSTGATKRSVTLRVNEFKTKTKAEVRAHTNYFSYLEYGTRFMSRRPTLGPAFSKIEPQFRADITKLFK